jgi:hypothetical protein
MENLEEIRRRLSSECPTQSQSQSQSSRSALTGEALRKGKQSSGAMPLKVTIHWDEASEEDRNLQVCFWRVVEES